jgi:hypothetical protein
VWSAVSKQGLIGLIFLKGSTTKQRYMQQLHTEVISVIPVEWYVDTTFFQQDGTRPHTVNVVVVVLAVLHDVSGSLVLWNRFQKCFDCGWSWPPCSPDMNHCYYFIISFGDAPSCVQHQPSHCSGHEIKVKLSRCLIQHYAMNAYWGVEV